MWRQRTSIELTLELIIAFTKVSGPLANIAIARQKKEVGN